MEWRCCPNPVCSGSPSVEGHFSSAVKPLPSLDFGKTLCVRRWDVALSMSNLCYFTVTAAGPTDIKDGWILRSCLNPVSAIWKPGIPVMAHYDSLTFSFFWQQLWWWSFLMNLGCAISQLIFFMSLSPHHWVQFRTMHMYCCFTVY